MGAALETHRGEIAAVIMEPFRGELPPEGYLAGVAKLAAEHDVILIFDEVSTGFRPHASGAQGLVGVVPDMAVFAKSISNGYPMGVVVGRRDVMQAASQMFISSTYWSDTIGLRAALTTLREVRRRDVPQIVHEIGTSLQSEITAAARETGLPARCEGLSFHPHITLDVADLRQRSQLATLFIQEMAKRGCHGYTSFYLNAAQTSGDIEQTVVAARESFQIMAEGLEQNNIDGVLECQQQVESFRRLVR